jgi:hypothetical protein
MGQKCIRSFGRELRRKETTPKCRWEDNTKMDLKEIVLERCIEFIWLRL